MTLFDTPPDDLPARFASPFAHGEPQALARRAADALQAILRAMPEAEREGKMFGVLVVETPDGIGWLRAFSGMLAGRWDVDGFAPPLFDAAARDAFWPAGEAELAGIEARLRGLGEEAAALAALDDEVNAMRERHRASKAIRAAARALATDAPARHALDQASRGDGAERRRLADAQRAERARIAGIVDAIAALERHRGDRSRALWEQILDSYRIENARGERRTLRALFAPDAPPGGAGDCAAPKLLGEAYRRGWRPLALAELWWGPPAGGREPGRFYPACRGKCGPILPFMLEGLPVDEAPVYGADAAPGALPVVFEDEWLIVVDKPCGLLSVPGRHARLRDSVLSRLPGVTIVHRLDLDTSGLLIAAKDPDTHATLQRSFAWREVDKRYVAWLDGVVAGDQGTIELPLRVDLDDRPRQIVDPVHGKRAVTDWQVLERSASRTRVAFHPHTGRTHQIRVHAAVGLGAPVAGDRLYGRGGERLLLHAEALTFTHPRTGARIALSSPAPF